MPIPPTDHPSFSEVEWMAAEGITTGYEDDTFCPGSPVSRGAMAALLDRWYGGPLVL